MSTPPANEEGFSTARVEMFSDAVMAVAITLMVLRIAPPDAAVRGGVGAAFWNDTFPEIIFFLITFTVIILFWQRHHDAMREFPRLLPVSALWVNAGFLACICLIPFGLEFFTTDGASVLTVAVYAGLMALATLLMGLLSRMARGRWSAEPFVGAGVFLLAVPFAPLLGSWCLLVWWVDMPIGWAVVRVRAYRDRAGA